VKLHMAKHRIAVIPGDNVGPEVINEGLKVLNRLKEVADLQVEWTSFLWGSEHYLRTGSVMPPDGLETLAQYDAIYLGALVIPFVFPIGLSLGVWYSGCARPSINTSTFGPSLCCLECHPL